jgi:hypothetical protein
MKLSEISHLLKTEHIYVIEFINLITNEMELYRRDFAKVGSTLNIYVIEDVEIIISLADCKSLCYLYLERKLDYVELAYIADVLQLSENVTYSSENLEFIIGEMTDPEINGSFTYERAKEIVGMAY